MFSDNTTVVIPKGAKGAKGENGTSIGISRTEVDGSGNTVVHFTDGKVITIPKVKMAHQ